MDPEYVPPSIIIDSDLDYDEYEEEEVGWGQETCWITDVWTNKMVVSALMLLLLKLSIRR